MSHSPGEWTAEEVAENAIDIVLPDCSVVASVVADEHLTCEDWANARLIQSAPAMFKLLQELIAPVPATVERALSVHAEAYRIIQSITQP